MDTAFAVCDWSLDDHPDLDLPAIGFALSILFGQFEGGEWDWSTLRWVKKDG